MARERWRSRLGFIMATVGFSVGLGNIWRFPYLAGQNGGGAFVVIYLILALAIGVPLFTAEISLGRRAQRTPIAGMRALTGRARSPWNLIGWLGVIAAFLILSYYQLIMGWIGSYLLQAVSGGLGGASISVLEDRFSAFTADPVAVLVPTAVLMALTGAIVSRGVQAGVERAARLLIPVLFLFLLVLAVGSLRLEGSSRGLSWYLSPDFGAVDGGVVLAALGQVFYSIGVGMAAAFVYGSYLDRRKSDVPGGAAAIVAFDTLAAFLAGLVIFPALFAMGLEPDAGPGLLFVTMSGLFARLPGGALAGGFFFFLVLIAGLTSGMALLEALTATAMESLGWGRRRSLWTVLGLVYLTGIPIALGFGPWAEVRPFGRGLFDLVDFVSGSVLLALGGLLIALYTAWAWGFERFRDETNEGAGRLRVSAAWRPLVRWVIPVAVVLVILSGIGLLG